MLLTQQHALEFSRVARLNDNFDIPSSLLPIARGLDAVLLSVLVASLAVLFSKILGRYAGWLIVLMFVITPWLSFMNVLQQVYSWYYMLPMTLGFWLLYLDFLNRKRLNKKDYLILGASFALAIILNRQAFILPQIIAALVPVLYFLSLIHI